MHVSRLFIENFRSIERLDLSFRPGVNILVGRNNAGKSNIIRALDVLLGEYSPTYQKGEVITVKGLPFRTADDQRPQD
jgi:putative ATP-dependent endonuclease of the OLD family